MGNEKKVQRYTMANMSDSVNVLVSINLQNTRNQYRQQYIIFWTRINGAATFAQG